MDKPLRLLMTADPIGGVWTYALELARALGPRRARIALATMGAALSAEQRAEAAACGNVQLFESRFRLEWMDEPWDDVDRAGAWLLKLAAAFEPDLVHLNGYAHGALPWPAPALIVAHSCVLSWWRAVHGHAAPARYDEYQARVAAGLGAVDAVIAPTRAMMTALRSHYGALPRAQVIGNARDPAPFAAAAKEPFALTAGRLWDRAKNVAAVCAAGPLVRWPIQVAGSGRCPDGNLAPLPNVEPLGQLTRAQMAARLARCAIYVLPARYEPFGLSALEAGLAGCALVLGDIASLREVWGDAAVFVNPDDPAALARELNDLIDDPARRADFGRRARRRALRFSPAAMADNYLAAYRSCVAQTREAVA